MAGAPRYHPVVVVDIAGYGGRDHVAQLTARKVLRQVMGAAFRAAALPWARRLWEDRGDGMLIVLPSDVSLLPLVSEMPRRLAGLLRKHNADAHPEHRIAVRLAVHAGSIHRDGSSYVGDAVNLAARVVDADPLREALREADSDVVIAISDLVYRETALHDYPEIDRPGYRQLVVQVKETRASVWIHLPEPLLSPPPSRFRRMWPRHILIAVAVMAVLAGAGAVFWSVRARSAAPDPDAMSYAAPSAPMTLRALHSGKCVTTQPGTDFVLQNPCIGPDQPYRQWRLQQALGRYRVQNNVFRLVNAGSGKCLTAVGKSTGEAVETHPRTCAGAAGSGQLWIVQKEQFTDGVPTGHLKNVDSGQCLDVNYNSADDGTFVILFFCAADHRNQYFLFRP